MQNTQSSRNTANFSAKLFAVAIIGILMSQTIAIGQTVTSDVFMSGTIAILVTPQRMFYARNYGGKCLDFGAPPQVTGGPVYLYGCNGTIAQQLRIVEINDRHEVRLYAGNKVVGVKDNGGKENGLSTSSYGNKEISLELQLQNEADLNTIFARNQVFALDGDSIIWAANRDLVVKVQNARGANRTPLVLGLRNFSDEEFWDITPTDGSGARPTKGFVRVTQPLDFRQAVNNAAWGTVIEIGADITLKEQPPLMLKAGVTIRGDRRGTRLGPQLWAPNEQDQSKDAGVPDGMLQIQGNEVRITGLRMRGPTRSLDSNGPLANGIVAFDRYTTAIDHNDMSDWTVAAVNVRGEYNPSPTDPQTRPKNVRVVRNFIHHQQNNIGDGYGVVTGNNGFPLIEGNTFLSNRHAIAGDATEQNGYVARLNLVQYPAPDYGGIFSTRYQQDFDMHGSDRRPECGACGGTAGGYMDISRNTFLGGNRLNFFLRGTPTVLAEFHDNVLVGSQSSVIKNFGDPNKLVGLSTNQFNATNPTNRLGVGDFDGDGREDLLLATGAAWYYASAGNAEWRFLNAQTDSINSLRFGDFDNDGRTDVFAQHGSKWDVSWGGISKWETINGSGSLLQDFTIGDFVGDRRADVFYADGQTWYISDGGVGPFTAINTSSFRVAALRFGDFNADGKMDVFSVVSGNWMVSYSGTSAWTYLRSKLTDSVSSLTVADFNGDGRADLATISLIGSSTLAWKVSYSGVGAWVTLRTDSAPTPSSAAIGRFDGNRSADMLRWNDNYLDIAASGSGAAQRQSRQDMR